MYLIHPCRQYEGSILVLSKLRINSANAILLTLLFILLSTISLLLTAISTLRSLNLFFNSLAINSQKIFSRIGNDLASITVNCPILAVFKTSCFTSAFKRTDSLYWALVRRNEPPEPDILPHAYLTLAAAETDYPTAENVLCSLCKLTDVHAVTLADISQPTPCSSCKALSGFDPAFCKARHSYPPSAESRKFVCVKERLFPPAASITAGSFGTRVFSPL